MIATCISSSEHKWCAAQIAQLIVRAENQSYLAWMCAKQAGRRLCLGADNYIPHICTSFYTAKSYDTTLQNYENTKNYPEIPQEKVFLRLI